MKNHHNEPASLEIWTKKAENDLKTAKDEFSTENPATDTICFHAQQCAEKYLKAFLIANDLEIPKTHILEELINMAKKLDPEFEDLLKDINISILSHYAVSARYPPADPFEEAFPSIEEAERAIKSAEKVRDFVLRKLKRKT